MSGCPFCEKTGLPILPVRYALARSDVNHAPEIKAPFEQSIALPSESAHYTLRLLREGYLYVYDEGIDDWSAYRVTEQGHLFEFDVTGTPPNIGTKTPCKRGADPYIARCFTVSDPASASIVWLGFSDAPWTSDVLQAHQDAGYRAEHMRSVDVSKYVKTEMVSVADAQPHTAPFDQLGSLVAEFSDTGLVPGINLGSLTQRSNSQDPEWPKFQRLLVQQLKQKAFSFSPFEFNAVSEQTQPLIEWAKTASEQSLRRLHDAGVTDIKSLTPLIVGLDDPVGVAVDINGLIPQRLAEWFEEDKERKWGRVTSATIKMLEHAIRKQAVEAEYNERVNQADREWGSGSNSLLPYSAATARRLEQEIREAREYVDRNAGDIGDTAWEKYQGAYNKETLEDNDDAFDSAVTAFDADTITPLSTAYLKWLDSDIFKRHFTHNFDPKNGDSGHAYVSLATLCMKDACGRADVLEKVKKDLQADPGERNNILMRALIFDQDALATKLVETDSLQSEQEVPWREMGEKLYEGLKEVLGQGFAHGGNFEGPLNSLAHYVYQVAGPVSAGLGEALDAGLAGISKMLPKKRLLAILSLVSWKPGQTWHLIPASANVARSTSDRMLASLTSQISSVQANGVSGATRAEIGNATYMIESQSSRVTREFRYMALLDQDTAIRIGVLSETTQTIRPTADGGVTTDSPSFRINPNLSDAQMQEVVTQATKNVTNTEFRLGLVGLIFGLWGLAASYKQDITEGDEWSKAKYGIAVSGVLGSMVELAGVAAQGTKFGATPINNAIVKAILKSESNIAGLARAGGKVVGAGAGIVLGLWQLVEGWQGYSNNRRLGSLNMLSGFGTVVVGFLVALNLVTGGVGLILFLGIAVLAYIGSFFVDDKFQAWLRKCYFGENEFASLAEQQADFDKRISQDKPEPRTRSAFDLPDMNAL